MKCCDVGSRIARPWALTQQDWQGVWAVGRGGGETGTRLLTLHPGLPTSQVLHCELGTIVRSNK